MKFFKIKFELLSPTIITERKSRTGFLKTPRYIPASTLKGAIIAELYRSGVVDENFVKSEAQTSIITSYAYPLVKETESYPCHPLMYKCKACGEVVNCAKDDVVHFLEEEGMLGNLAYATCSMEHATLENLCSKVYPDPGSIRSEKAENPVLSYRAICVLSLIHI